MENNKNSDRWIGEFNAYLGAPFTMLCSLFFHKNKHYPKVKIAGYLLDAVVIALATYMLFFRE